MSQQAIGFHQREINRRMAERGMPTAAWSAEQVAADLRWRMRNMAAWMNLLDKRNESLRAELAKVNGSPYSPAFMAAIAGTCSTPASRVGKTQAEVFDEESKQA